MRSLVLIVTFGLALPAPAQEPGTSKVVPPAPQPTTTAKPATEAKPATKAEPPAAPPKPRLLPSGAQLGGRIVGHPGVQILVGPGVHQVQRHIVVRNGRLLVEEQPRPSRLVQGKYADALKALEDATRTMKTSEDIDAAMKAIDDATKALMQARAALWKQRDAADKKPTQAPATDRK